MIRFEVEAFCEGSDGLAAEIHVGGGFDKGDGVAIDFACADDGAIAAAIEFDFVAVGEKFDDGEADVMARAAVFGAGVAETDDHPFDLRWGRWRFAAEHVTPVDAGCAMRDLRCAMEAGCWPGQL